MARRLIPFFALLLGGCLDRDEVITVHSDGSADVVLACSGDAGDFDDMLVMPEGWKVEKIKDGDKTVWTARASLRDLNKYPNRDANFPYQTRLKVTTQGNLRTFDFERTYPQMDARDILAIDEAFWKNDEARVLITQLHDKGIAGLADHEATRLFELAGQVEREKQMAVVARALQTHAEAKGMPWRDRLDALAKIEADYRAKVTGPALIATVGRRLETVDRYDAFARGLRDRAAQHVPGLGPSLEAAATATRAAHALSDDNFKLKVRLPGMVVAGNYSGLEGGVASWEFSGQALGATPMTLRATSVEVRR